MRRLVLTFVFGVLIAFQWISIDTDSALTFLTQDSSILILLLAFVSLSFGLGLLAGQAVFNKQEASFATEAHPQELRSNPSDPSGTTQNEALTLEYDEIEDPKASLWLCRIHSDGIFFD